MSKQEFPHVLPKDDGYTVTAFIKGKDRMYGDVRVQYRPVLVPEWAEFADRAPQDPVDRMKHHAAGLAGSIVSWSCRDRDGKVVDVTVDNVMRLHRDLFLRLVDIVIHSAEGGDPDPEEVKKLSKDTEPLDDPFGRKAKSPAAAVGEQLKN